VTRALTAHVAHGGSASRAWFSDATAVRHPARVVLRCGDSNQAPPPRRITMATYAADNGMKDQAKDIKDQVKGLVDAGHDKVNEVKDKLMDAKEKVVDRADSLVTSLTDSIKARPLVAVGIAFGIGYLAMRIFRR
jgi:ElaB/YqjD/DUF883 family membrane-anchored ribosome-binding protein